MEALPSRSPPPREVRCPGRPAPWLNALKEEDDVNEDDDALDDRVTLVSTFERASSEDDEDEVVAEEEVAGCAPRDVAADGVALLEREPEVEDHFAFVPEDDDSADEEDDEDDEEEDNEDEDDAYDVDGGGLEDADVAVPAAGWLT